MRINVLPVRELTDQHLVAEYREIKMLPKALVRTLKSKNGLDKSKISKNYTLNTGHGYFFYDKLIFIENRFTELVSEMYYRNFKTNSCSLYDKDYDYSLITKDLRNDYTPTIDAINLNKERINLRISQKPSFYKYFSKKLN